MLRRCLWLIALALPGAALASEPTCEVNVNVTLTPAGRKLPAPDPAHPAYYFPLIGGWRERGALVAGEKPPPVHPIVRELAQALALRGYLVVPEATRAPSLLLVFFWGSLNPQIDEVGPDPNDSQKIFYNQREMLALVGGSILGMLDLGFEREAVMQGAEEDRYFVIVRAYDFAAARAHRKELLWSAQMSTPSSGQSIAEVLPALIAGGGPHFGRETVRPAWVKVPLGRTGRVEVGPTTIVPDPPGGPPR